jgi:linear primary-alkylsulfatase
MKIRVIAVVELLIIIVLCAVLLNQLVSFKKTGPVVREPEAPGESRLSYIPPPPPKVPLASLGRVAELREAFTPKVTKITDDIFHATGYALGSVQMVVTDDGLVIIDTTESKEAARAILKEFRKITDKPIRYIIYTHGHTDHVYGSTVFMEGNTEVIATADAVQFMKKDFGWLAEYHNRSRHIQFGDIAPEYALPGVGFSTTRLPPFSSEEDIVFPTKTFDREYAFLLGGKRFELYHTSGETPDHLMVWLPDERALFCGDLYYLSFPNLHSPMLEPRPVRGWYESLDRMTRLNAKYLIPGHTQAIVGAEKVRDALTAHSQAIKSVYEQTIACINQGKSVEEAVRLVRLPPELAQMKQLQEVYGRVDWSVRGIYRGEIGWYDGWGTGLDPLPSEFLARELVTMIGGADKILVRAMELQRADEHKLVCELCDLVIRANPKEKVARVIKSNSLDNLAITSGNLNMFGFYRSAAAMERQVAGGKP